MAATFRSVVLGQPEIMSMVFEFQFGLYEDIRPAFYACNELVAFVGDVYECDSTFREVFAPEWDGTKQLYPSVYALHGHQEDARLPLHVAIAEGFVHLAKRIVQCRPDLASRDAITLGFVKGRLVIAFDGASAATTREHHGAATTYQPA